MAGFSPWSNFGSLMELRLLQEFIYVDFEYVLAFAAHEEGLGLDGVVEREDLAVFFAELGQDFLFDVVEEEDHAVVGGGDERAAGEQHQVHARGVVVEHVQRPAFRAVPRAHRLVVRRREQDVHARDQAHHRVAVALCLDCSYLKDANRSSIACLLHFNDVDFA